MVFHLMLRCIAECCAEDKNIYKITLLIPPAYENIQYQEKFSGKNFLMNPKTISTSLKFSCLNRNMYIKSVLRENCISYLTKKYLRQIDVNFAGNIRSLNRFMKYCTLVTILYIKTVKIVFLHIIYNFTQLLLIHITKIKL